MIFSITYSTVIASPSMNIKKYKTLLQLHNLLFHSIIEIIKNEKLKLNEKMEN